MFFSYLDYFNTGTTDDKNISLIGHIESYLSSTADSEYFIMDPHIDIQKSLKDPFYRGKTEIDNWSFLIATLAGENVTFNVITKDKRVNSELGDESPLLIPLPENMNGTIIQVCKYPDKAYNKLCLHDRYIIKKDRDGLKGLHIGPSLSAVDDKDVSITEYSSVGVGKAYDNFKKIWDECIKTKAWKTS